MYPESYLMPGDEDIGCILSIMPNDEEDDDADQSFLMGDAFLRHFYQVYDYEKQQVRLAVDSHSKKIVSIGDIGASWFLIMTSFFFAILLLVSCVCFWRCSKKDAKQIEDDEDT
jgi:predicted solute-binding protein